MPQFVVFTRREELKSFIRETRKQQKSVGFVPTMGALHEGHATLLRRAVAENDAVVLSIFVNPIQFGQNEDFSAYPRQLQEDTELAKTCGVKVIFAPLVAEMYPAQFSTTVSVDATLTGVLCGAYRPGHFDGVCTVVALLLNLVAPHRAYFGLKDFQQFTVLKRMAADLALDVEMVPCVTVRDDDAVAMSSRNQYLDEESRVSARTIPNVLAQVGKAYLSKSDKLEPLLRAARQQLEAAGFEVQYFEARNADTLELVHEFQENIVIAFAGFVKTSKGPKKVRLIDNVVLSQDQRYLDALNDLIKKVESYHAPHV